MGYNIEIDKKGKELMSTNLYTKEECEKKAKEFINSIHEQEHSNNNFLEKLKIKKEEKTAEYQQFWAERNYYKEQVSIWESNYATNPNNKEKYDQMVTLFNEAELNSDITRASLNDLIYFEGRMSMQNILFS